MIKNADSLSLKTKGEVLHSAMPKQDKGGGIIPTAEGARLRISRLRGGAAKCRPAVLFFRPLLAF